MVKLAAERVQLVTAFSWPDLPWPSLLRDEERVAEPVPVRFQYYDADMGPVSGASCFSQRACAHFPPDLLQLWRVAY
jgi:hypothetical protein